MDFLLVTFLPCSLVVLSLVRMLPLLKASRVFERPVAVCLTAGVTALSMLWAAVAVSTASQAGPVPQEFLAASTTHGPVLAFVLLVVLFGESAALAAARALSTLLPGKKRVGK